jgi:hypothetical protein
LGEPWFEHDFGNVEYEANDFELVDGSIIPQPLGDAELLGVFASASLGYWPLVGVSPMQFICAHGTSGQTVVRATAPTRGVQRPRCQPIRLAQSPVAAAA